MIKAPLYSSLQVSEVHNAGQKIRYKEFLPAASCLKIHSFVLQGLTRNKLSILWGGHPAIGVKLSPNPFKTSLKPRFQPLAGNAPHCGSAATQEAEPQRRAFPV
ncbi:MAG: hypothetical protein V7L14_32255 [Nostoc sp.]